MDSDYAPAYADLASAYSLALSYRYDIGVDAKVMAARAMTYAEKALDLNRNLASGYAARGLLGIQIGRPAAAIAADFDRAENLSPNSASIPSWRSLAQAELGNTAEAFAEATRAVALDPLAPSRQIALANVAFQLGRYEEAIAAARIATALEPKLIRGRAIEARSQILLGRPEACVGLLLSAYRVLRATCFEAAGLHDEAEVIIDRVLDEIDAGRNSVPEYTEVITFEELATYYAVKGDAVAAQNWVTQALAASPAGIEFRVLDSPLFDAVRGNHDFSSSVEAIRANLFDQVSRRAESLKDQIPN
jgi:tetratricopeptide (TPR) repeat protein